MLFRLLYHGRFANTVCQYFPKARRKVLTTNLKHSASASLAGYLYQCRLALLLGLQMAKKKPNGHLSIEQFDDIAFEDEDLSLCLFQAKHSVKAKSMSDSSVDVWKTLHIWIEHLDQGVIPFRSTKFVLITTSSAPVGSAMELLRPGASPGERTTCILKLRKIAQSGDNESTLPARRRFLSLTDEQARTLLNQIEVLDNHPNPVDVMEDIEGELILTAPRHTTQAALNLEGWWLGVVARCLLDSDSPAIPVQHIIMKDNEIGRSFGEDALPLDDPDKLGVKGYSTDDEAQLFVKQMRVVGLPDRVVRRGVQDYYRAYAQRSKWAREKFLLDTGLSKYDKSLEDRCERKLDEELTVGSTVTETEKKTLGCRLCLWVSQQSFPLRNIVEAWITAGSYQGLADRLRIG